MFIYRLDRWARGRLKEEEAKEEGAENYEFRYVPTNLLGDDGKLYEVRHKYYKYFDQDGGIYTERSPCRCAGSMPPGRDGFREPS